MATRLSQQGLRVLKMFLEAPRTKVSGAEISKALKIGSGTLYPLLFRFEKAGWLRSEWEDVDVSVEGRPAKRLYEITPEGQNQGRAALQELNYQPGGLVWNT